MSTAKQKMADLAVAIGVATPRTDSQQAVKPEKQKALKIARPRRSETKKPAAENRPRRTPGGLKQVTIKLEPGVRGRLLQESLRRKAEDAENWPIQQIVTEAVNAYLGEK
jgi:hypothetical protein